MELFHQCLHFGEMGDNSVRTYHEWSSSIVRSFRCAIIYITIMAETQQHRVNYHL